ncbi:MAG: hypothetical protein ACK5NB_12075 [Flavobacteriaceae bacterium]
MIKSVTHKITAFVLVIILLAHNINTLVIVTDFIVNQDFIAKTLCIQKNDQQGCNGKCQLTKQLAKSETGTNDQAPQPTLKRMALDVFFVSEINTVEICPTPPPTEKNKIHSTVANFKSNSLTVDTPPPNFS